MKKSFNHIKSKAAAENAILELQKDPRSGLIAKHRLVTTKDIKKLIAELTEAHTFWAKAVKVIKDELKDAYAQIEINSAKLMPKGTPKPKGGAREGAGRKKEIKTQTVRVPVEIAPLINKLGKIYKANSLERPYLKELLAKITDGH